MTKERRKELKNAVLEHIIGNISGELQYWDNLKVYLSVELKNEHEDDVVNDMFISEVNRLKRRINVI